MKRFLIFAISSAVPLALLPHVGLGSTTKNDQMVVAVNNARLMCGNSTLATLPAGHHFDVIRRQGAWVGT